MELRFSGLAPSTSTRWAILPIYMLQLLINNSVKPTYNTLSRMQAGPCAWLMLLTLCRGSENENIMESPRLITSSFHSLPCRIELEVLTESPCFVLLSFCLKTLLVWWVGIQNLHLTDVTNSVTGFKISSIVKPRSVLVTRTLCC